MSEVNARCEIKLTASPGAWRLHSARQSDPRFQPFAQRIFERDQYTCQFCGFRAKQYQDIINLDQNYNHNAMDNLVTSCCFCAQCFFIESVGVGGYGGGTLIYMPEMTQEALNSLCHVLFCAIYNDTGYKNTAQTIYLNFKIRSQYVEKKFGEGSSDPSTFGHLLIDVNDLTRESQDRVMQGVRLLPSRAKFRQQIEAWAADAVGEMAKIDDVSVLRSKAGE